MKSTGNIIGLKLNLTEPMGMNMDLSDMKQFQVFVGKNGTGKTLILITIWCTSFVTQGIVAAALQKDPNFSPVNFAQFVFEKSFSDFNFDGSLKATFKECDIEIFFDKGKVTKVLNSGFDKIDQPIPALFMSSQMRLFSSMSMYLKLRKAENVAAPNEAIPKMIKHFKLYDVIAIERLIHRMPVKFDKDSPGMLGMLEDDEYENLHGFGVDLEECDFYALVHDKKDGVKEEPHRKYLTTYGNGHQSIINMYLQQP